MYPIQCEGEFDLYMCKCQEVRVIGDSQHLTRVNGNFNIPLSFSSSSAIVSPSDCLTVFFWSVSGCM